VTGVSGEQTLSEAMVCLCLCACQQEELELHLQLQHDGGNACCYDSFGSYLIRLCQCLNTSAAATGYGISLAPSLVEQLCAICFGTLCPPALGAITILPGMTVCMGVFMSRSTRSANIRN